MARTLSPNSITFKVQRSSSELIAPSKPTPYEFKPLSDLDNLDWWRAQVRGLVFFPHNPSMNGVDPAKVIRAAIAETLVFYYPLAGRLREGPTGKLTVECTGEGILFIEADADVTLDQFGYPLIPPFSCSEQVLYEEPGLNDILNCPPVLIQVTRLKCGGFIFGIRLNHTLYDATGQAQFMSAIAEVARGATSPSVLPVWERHIFNSRNPEFVNNNNTSQNTNNVNYSLENDLCNKAFIFGRNEISILRRSLPLHLRDCSSFEIITSAIWKCRVAAIQPHPTELVNIIWAVNLRGKPNHFIPVGYYGNAAGLAVATSTSKEIIENPLSYVLEVLRNAKENVFIEDHDRSMIKKLTNLMTYIVSNLKYVGFGELDFGWGKTIYGGLGNIITLNSGLFHTHFNREKGENEMVLPFSLPKQAMKKFEMELNNMLKDQSCNGGDGNDIASKL